MTVATGLAATSYGSDALPSTDRITELADLTDISLHGLEVMSLLEKEDASQGGKIIKAEIEEDSVFL